MSHKRRVLGRFARVLTASASALAVCIAGFAVGIHEIGGLTLYRADPVKLPALAEPSVVYAADCSQLAVLGDEDREPVTYDQIPAVVADAVVATEDRTFWTNSGVDPAGLVRALVTDLASGRVVEGGSTVTEQLVKNRLLDPKHSAKKKLEEIALASQTGTHVLEDADPHRVPEHRVLR